MLPVRSLLCILLFLVSYSRQSQIPPRDYDKLNYFLVELNTTHSQKPLVDFISQYKDHYRFEHQVHSLDNYYVFSIDKQHPHNSFLGNHNSNNHNRIKRSPGFEDVHDHLINNIQSLHMLPPKKLSKRLPVFIDAKDVQEAGNGGYDGGLQTQQPPSEFEKAQKRLAEVSIKLGIQDPEFASQWHLLNLKYPGHDVNATGLWMEDILGQGIVTAIVDDGLDAESEDLQENFSAKGSWDFNDNVNIPLPRLFDDYHGTRCAGEIAAVKNDVCGIGVAYKSQVAGIRILSGSITSAEEAAAMCYGLDVNDIYSCSWGPTDNGRTLSEPEVVVKQAMIKGIQEGRNNKGAIYVFASGNGGRFSDSCNFDGYTNSIYSITVGAIDYKGIHPAYSEACSAVMVVTYSSGSGEHIHTTDIKKKCSASHGGTSAAAPLASGIFSLILSVNPDLTWRDLQYINVLSATPINEEDGNYQTTALGRLYSHRYGYGKTDAYKMVQFAKTWKNVKPQAWYYSDVIEVNQKISLHKPPPPMQQEEQEEEENPLKIIKSTITVTKEDLKVMNVDKVEHITVKVNIGASFRGRVGVRLISPSGVISDLATFRPGDSSFRGFEDWTFMSVAHWGEDGLGEWEIEVFSDDSHADPIDIEFKNWQFRIFGESIDADKAETYELLKDYAAVRRDRIEEGKNKEPEATTNTSTEEGATSTTEEPLTTSSTPEDSTTTTTTAAATTELSTSTVSTTTTTESPSSTPTGDDDDDDHEEEGGLPTDEPDDGKHKSSNHTGQYFMALAVLGFIAVLVIMKRQRSAAAKRRMVRDDFEFDIIPGDDYTDSDDEEDNRPTNPRPRSHFDSFDLGRDGGKISKQDDAARDRLFEQFNAESLPDYDDEMFKIGEDEEEEEEEDDRLVGGSGGIGKDKDKDKKKVAFKNDSKSGGKNKDQEEGKSLIDHAEGVDEGETETTKSDRDTDSV
ncbi:uncharacterized protein LODBEIA_P07710 [Lodderomyces beijingensis]|uniref:P/Homo B domain-containing protein n=1 Tax=Lodderomyces beijingensis TaxID=1775926 RepID=A0ABP0ZGM3_9ASCO